MSWLAYFILAYIAVGLQVGIGPYVQINSARPDLVLVAVVFVALNAPRDAALLGAFLLGAAEDMVSGQPLGLYAFSYGLVGLFVVAAQHVVQREHPLTHFSMTLGGGLITAIVLVAHETIRPSHPGRSAEGGVILPPLHLATWPLFGSALYSAIVAPLVLVGLDRLKRLFNFQTSRRARSY